MRIAQLRSMDVSNGPGIGVSLFTQGCPYHCPGCFNASTWDMLGGREMSDNELLERVRHLLSQDHMTRLSILGGEPLMPQNVGFLTQLVCSIMPQIKVWCWTGSRLESLLGLIHNGNSDDQLLDNMCWDTESRECLDKFLHNIDVLVDGRFIESEKDLTLKWRGSRNQRVIDLQATLKSGIITLVTQ